MRHHADRNRLHTRLFKSAPINRFAAVQGTPRRFSSWSIHLFATCRVRVWRPILHPLPLTLLARLEYKP